MNVGLKPRPNSSNREVLAGLIERVTNIMTAPTAVRGQVRSGLPAEGSGFRTISTAWHNQVYREGLILACFLPDGRGGAKESRRRQDTGRLPRG